MISNGEFCKGGGVMRSPQQKDWKIWHDIINDVYSIDRSGCLSPSHVYCRTYI